MTEDNLSLTHDRLAASFDDLMNQYDLARRLTILIDDFISSISQTQHKILDAGCGTGYASKRLKEAGYSVTSIDIGFNLARKTKERAKTDTAQSSILDLPFSPGSFDIVFSTEVIEHVPQPLEAVTELWRVIKPGGWLVLSTPNRLWQLPVRFASAFGFRPYDGYENFLWPSKLRNHVLDLGGKILNHRGIHLFPFQIQGLRKINTKIDRYGEVLLPLMINQAILCQK